MTGDEFSGVDFDLLADYAGGALDGTPEHGTVAALIATDHAWRAAYDELTQGMAAVGAELNALGTAPEPMPADLVARLDEAFAAPASAAARQADAGLAGAAPVDAGLANAGPAASDAELGAPGRPRLEAVPGGASGSRRARVRKNGLNKRWVAPIAVAAGVIAFVGFGLDYLGAQRNSTTDSAASSAGRGESAPMMATDQAPPAAAGSVAGLPPAAEIRSSGIDYQPSTLANSFAATDQKKVVPAPADESSRAVDALSRLRPPAARLACLDAISAENGAGAITAQSVDYARFEGAPALVVRFTAANGTWVWASGADCGTPSAGASTLDRVKVG